MSTRTIVFLAALVLGTPPALAQVHYHPNGRPWTQRANSGPDGEVDGWYYNLGITGLRVQLLEEEPTHLLVKHVFEDTPAARKVRVGDVIVGVAGNVFETEHINGYGMDKFGPEGPIEDFARALETSQGKKEKGRLAIQILREGKTKDVVLKVGKRYGVFEDTFPAKCDKTETILDELYVYLIEHQRDDGSWGSAPRDTFAPLALLASGERKYRSAVEKNVRWHARSTTAEGRKGGLVNWSYMSAAIVMSEYYLATKEKWVLKELEEVYTFLISTQYVSLDQVNPRVRESHPDSWPKDALAKHGGWGHNPGFEGYGPISMITGQGALAFALMKHCGIDVDRERHDAAYAFLERGTGSNGYLWYGDSAAGDRNWADMGRTGASATANFLSPYRKKSYKDRAHKHATVIGEHPESFPDTHASPIMGMGYAAMGACFDKHSFQALMDANRWWFTLAQCADGSFYYQPNRDNSGYGADSRIKATAVAAFILSIPNKSLHVTGKPFKD